MAKQNPVIGAVVFSAKVAAVLTAAWVISFGFVAARHGL
mgnify:CR=1 FL=1|jgi:hypothetical protein